MIKLFSSPLYAGVCTMIQNLDEKFMDLAYEVSLVMKSHKVYNCHLILLVICIQFQLCIGLCINYALCIILIVQIIRYFDL